METIARKAVHTPANENANHVTTLSLMGTPTAVKITHAQT